MTAPRSVIGSAAALAAVLGDPAEAVRHDAALDAAEGFPAEVCARLDGVGFPALYVPTEWGGALDDHERLLRLWRIVARRDVSALVAHGKTYLGAASVWIAGSAVQSASTAAAVLSGGQVAWALSEPEHGADLLNGSVTAAEQDGGYRLDGVKWPINNATRAGHLVVLARTGSAADPRGHSLFLVDKKSLPAGSYRLLPKVATHGIRGVDISGIEFTGAPVPTDALIGPAGTGVETVLRALQLTRTMCGALSLGAGEHALRLVARFTATRIIQRRPLIDRPVPASVLARCAALLGAAEAATFVATRSIHSLTREMSVTSAVVKALVPTLIDAVIGDLAELLGARSFLTEAYEHGAFQKVRRDHQIAAVFDGSTPVNRAALIQQFPRLTRDFVAGAFDAAGVAQAARVGERPGPLDRGALVLLSRQGCSVVQSLPALAEEIGSQDAPIGLAEHADALCVVVRHLHGLMAEVRPAARPSIAAYELASAYELCYAGAACLHLWKSRERHHRDEPLWRDGLWVRAALRALLARLAVIVRTVPPSAAPGDELIDGRLAGVVAEAAVSGAVVTAFGAAMPQPSQWTGDCYER
ncbi:acyl-CoA dehydrogenase [Frankia sp. Cas3]|uniref:acyl-CoA dehydrogenase family protein n=1 Tax=Frankia sp. Cas3 TaxID=3073926 RepID=UPI002AD487B7|nr:acyl-CoA dehydrogenase [Frankia sp. Cas3]